MYASRFLYQEFLEKSRMHLIQLNIMYDAVTLKVKLKLPRGLSLGFMRELNFLRLTVIQ